MIRHNSVMIFSHDLSFSELFHYRCGFECLFPLFVALLTVS